MKLNNRLHIILSLFATLLMPAGVCADKDNLEASQSNDNEVVINIDFKVTEQFSGIKESASAKRQMTIQFDEWQEVELDKYFIKYKVTGIPADGNESQKLFLIETELLNIEREKFKNAASVVKANKVFAMKISGHTINEPEFSLSFEIVLK